ncbi:MAG TPA: FG-GAP-like repeat-containing protein [Telluria sp.]|nr:FG-GAP-like repeat-containing protein [Telluria sp.]
MVANAADYYKVVFGQIAMPANSVQQAVPEIVDANRDGIPDILVFGAYYPFNGTTPTGQPSVLMLGKADGTFTANTSLIPASMTTIHPREVVQADFNKDGIQDLFVAGHGYDTTPYPGEQNRLLLGLSGGGYADASANLPQLSDFSHSATAADINGDGNLDLFVGNMSSNASQVEPYVLLGDGTGKFSMTTAGLPVGPGGYLNRQTGTTGLTSSLLTDLNGDGRPDLVIGNEGNPYQTDHRSLVYWNTGAGFSASNVTFLPQGYFGDARIVHDISAMDIDGDGDKDLMLLSSESVPMDAYADGWSLEVLRNEGGAFVNATSSHFQAGETQEGLPNTKSNVGASQFIRLMDVNGDGTQDIVITQFMNQLPGANTPIVWTNDGFGHFEVALRAGQLTALTNDSYFVGPFSLPYMNEKGLNFAGFGINNGTIYYKTVQATQMLPAAAKITATTRNDTIVQNRADNQIDGGAGLDKVVYQKAASSYTVTAQTGGFRIVDKSGADGTDTITGVERLQFGDTAVALDIDSVGGQAYRLYNAVLGRTPDAAGLGYWMASMDKGMSLGQVASYMIAGEEFVKNFGANLSNQALVQTLYQNILDRTPEQAGLDYWVNALNDGKISQAEALAFISEGFENRANVDPTIANGFAYAPWG